MLKAARAHPPHYSLLFEYYEGGNVWDALHRDAWKVTPLHLLHLALQCGAHCIGVGASLVDAEGGQSWGWVAGRALLYLHQRGILHRDVKPANILVHYPPPPAPHPLPADCRGCLGQLDGQGNAFLTDFGLAAHTTSLAKHTAENWKGVGQPTGGFQKATMGGTLQYMAPEVLSNQCPTESADVFSYAVSVNEVATGVVPYSDRLTAAQAHTVVEMSYGEHELAAAIVGGLRPVLMAPTSLCPSLPALLGRCWQAAPSDRPSMADVVAQLEQMVSRGGEEAQRSGETGKGGAMEEEADWAKLGEAEAGGVGKEAGEGREEWGQKEGSYVPLPSYGAFATIGGREAMEDRHFMRGQVAGLEHVYAFGVFDGHRGKALAARGREYGVWFR